MKAQGNWVLGDDGGGGRGGVKAQGNWVSGDDGGMGALTLSR